MPDCDHCDYCVLDVYEGTVTCALGFDYGDGCEMYQSGALVRSNDEDEGWLFGMLAGYEGDDY